jgi:peptidoglycan/LPS O-acetylase OafA/YrhL
MDEQQPKPAVTPHPKMRYWLRTAAVAVLAVIVSVVVSAVAQNQRWPHPESIAFAAFAFLIPILQSVADRRRVRNWPARLAGSVALGVIGGFLYALVVER